ncbi:MAG TPA: N-acetyltransferase [Phototrophicaceae bacterium]|nr:N-acetyltransferase [Phototrophicaceae bacterium]
MIKIRPEALKDYPAIAQVNARAFNPHVSVPLIVDLHRHRSRFDPELSLVAEVDGRIVGHVLFSPQAIRLMGQNVEVVNLSPLAVAPEHQNMGVGSALVAEGHRIAKAKGYSLSFLIGHPPYYPRFGYRQRAFGASTLKVSTQAFQECSLEARLPTEADLPALCDLWLHEEGAVDFAIDPGDAWLDWLSPNPAVKALVYTQAGEIVGYARVNGAKAHYFLARDGETARQMAKQIGTEVELPLHPYSASAQAFGEPTYSLWDAAMVCTFEPSPFDDYYAQVQAGQRIAGRPIWGVEFDIS